MAASLLPVRQALRQKLGVDISPATVWRWATRGSRGTRLETVKIGKRLFVSEQALDLFIRGQQAGPAAAAPAGERSAEDREALRRAGLLRD
jgi:hypothetical protein